MTGLDARAAASGQAVDAYQRARQRRLDRHPDPYIRAVSRFAERGLDICDCPCHWHRDAREAVPCCASRGLRWAGDGFVPWSSNEDDSDG